jgi:hypothetical protein
MASTPMVQELLKAAGMKDAYDEGVAEIIRKYIRKDTGRKVTKTITWPGTPISNHPLVFTPTLHAMVESGECKLVKVPVPTTLRRKGYTTYVTFA